MNRKLLTQLIILIATLVLVCPLLSSPVNPIPLINENTLIVDISGSGDYTSIKDAINAAKTTDIIEIKEGIYKENNIEISKKLTIVGENPSSTILDFGGENGFRLFSTHIDLSGLKLTNAREYAIDVGPQGDGCSISNCIIDKYGAGRAIAIEASSVVVSNCNISGYNSTAIGISLVKHDNIIRGCTIQGFDVGVLIQLNAFNNKVLNCNLVNNQVAIDIRISSNENTVSECNIYSNAQGLYVWQSSIENLFYRNNFWKNDVDAVDEFNNSWDNGIQGNYWDNYRGQDSNNDGIGDTPYIILIGSKDNYPIMTMIVPDVITLPTNIKQATSLSDDTPSFTWTRSVYSKSIKGYYVKIDTNPETFIGDVTSWISPTNISNGVHIFYIRAETTDNVSSMYATAVFYIDTSANPTTIDSDADGYTDAMELSYGTNPLDQTSHPVDTDQDGIPDDNSPDGKYIGDLDDDNDGLADVEEIKLGSNSKDELDVKKVYLAGNPYYLVDVNKDGSFDVLYNQATETTTGIEKKEGTYLIDQNGNGAWDYTYNTADGSVSQYSEKIPIMEISIILILVIVAILSIVSWYYVRKIRTRVKYSKYKGPEISEEKPVEKLPMIRKPVSTIPKNIGDDRRYTVEMMNETRILLQRIEQDFAEYVEKLREMDEQIEENYPELDKQKIYQEPKKSEIKGMEDIESEVDKLLSELSKK